LGGRPPPFYYTREFKGVKVKLMTRLGLARRLAKKGYRYKDAEKIVNDMIQTMADILAEGEDIHIQNFGRFEIYNRKIGHGDRPKWASTDLTPDDTFKSIKFVPHNTLRMTVGAGVPFVIDKRMGKRKRRERYRGPVETTVDEE